MEYENHFKENPYKDFAQTDADKITRSLFEVKKIRLHNFLTTQRPNIVFIIIGELECILHQIFRRR